MPRDFGEKDIGRSQQVDLLTETVKELSEDELGAGINVNESF